MRTIDLDTWDRKEHYLFFRRSDYPHYHIGANLDITRFKAATKERGTPFSFAMTHAATTAMNAVEAFRYRIWEGVVVLHEQLHPYFSYKGPEDAYFKMVLAQMQPDMHAFARQARDKALAQKRYFLPEDTHGRSDLVFISSIPEVSFTHLSHTITLANKEDAVPRLSWGKYYGEGGRLLIPFNVQAHHAFVDGEHMGLFFGTLQEVLNRAEG